MSGVMSRYVHFLSKCDEDARQVGLLVRPLSAAASLIEAGSTLADQGVAYSVVDSAYILTFTIAGENFTFDSATETGADFVGGFINLPG